MCLKDRPPAGDFAAKQLSTKKALVKENSISLSLYRRLNLDYYRNTLLSLHEAYEPISSAGAHDKPKPGLISHSSTGRLHLPRLLIFP